MQAELAFLRAEMDLNRKYIFERPAALVIGAVTAAATLYDGTFEGFDLLPALFTALFGFNLWFTHNRLQSTARIISYLQVVHTPDGAPSWIGWEAALRKFRSTKVERVRTRSVPRQPEASRFYGPILLFHVLAVLATTGLILAQVYPDGIDLSSLARVQRAAVIVDVVAVIGLLGLAWWVRPITVRHTIDDTRRIWERAFGREPEDG